MDIRKIIMLFSVGITFAWSIILIGLWFTAFFNGDITIFTINQYGERDIELLMMIVCIPIIIYGTISTIRSLLNESC